MNLRERKGLWYMGRAGERKGKGEIHNYVLTKTNFKNKLTSDSSIISSL